MLTAKENFLETIRGGKPDRFVNQYEALCFIPHPHSIRSRLNLKPGDHDVPNVWGVLQSFPENSPTPFPEHTPDKVLIKDIEEWEDYVKKPSLKFSDEEWAACREAYEAVDNTKVFRTAAVTPGLFEHSHHMCSMEEALVNYIANPDEMHGLINYITDWELELAEGICSHLHPEAIHHHDDWGSELSTFLRPEMFAEYFVEPYKKIYGYYHDHGVQVIVHHSDSYAATLVPYMVEMGIDVWQGVMRSNNIPELIEKYGGQIAFMGGIDNKLVDFEGWTREDCRRVAKETCESFGMKYFIPCITQGLPGSMYPGAYATLFEEIDRYNMERFGVGDPEKMRTPMQIM